MPKQHTSNAPIIILGPTASGKTALSLFLAQYLSQQGRLCDILVVDSKQVYSSQNIVTGKDMPAQFQTAIGSFETRDIKHEIPYFTDGSTRIFGVDIVNPDHEWSIAGFLSYAQLVRVYSLSQNRQFIIVGGTPLYTLALFHTPETALVAPDQDLRAELALYSIEQLQERLQKISWKHFALMNESDKRNPRRLVRAIEISLAKKLSGGWLPAHQAVLQSSTTLLEKEKCLWIGLQVPKELLQERINHRVLARLAAGAVAEYNTLASSYPNWSKEARSTLGYFDIGQYVQRKITKSELVSLWSLHEMQYAKRQMTWWKREKQIKWFDALDEQLHQKVGLFIQMEGNVAL